MSNAVSALQGASYTGYVTVKEQGLQGMITLRGSLDDKALRSAVKKLTGLDVPGVTGCAFEGGYGVAWMSPDELMILCPYAEAPEAVAKLSDALKGTHHLVANLSDARAVFHVIGAQAREVIAKLAPVDMSPDAFPEGHARRTRLAQVPAAFWMRGEDTVELICFRSQAKYVYDLLGRAALPGSEI